MPAPIEVRKVPLHNVSDASELAKLIDDGVMEADRVVAVIGKTEGNGGVNDYTRIIADRAFREVLMEKGTRRKEEVKQIPIVWSGGTDGVISPHATIFATLPEDSVEKTDEPRLTVGYAMSDVLLPEDIGRISMVEKVAEGVRRAMEAAGITDPADVHYVQTKTPLLTIETIRDAQSRGKDTYYDEPHGSMDLSNGTTALGIAVALGEIEMPTQEQVMRDLSLFSAVASCSSGVELDQAQIVVVGNARGHGGNYRIGHSVMKDALDQDGIWNAIRDAGLELPERPHHTDLGDRLVNVFLKCEARPDRLRPRPAQRDARRLRRLLAPPDQGDRRRRRRVGDRRPGRVRVGRGGAPGPVGRRPGGRDRQGVAAPTSGKLRSGSPPGAQLPRTCAHAKRWPHRPPDDGTDRAAAIGITIGSGPVASRERAPAHLRRRPRRRGRDGRLAPLAPGLTGHHEAVGHLDVADQRRRPRPGRTGAARACRTARRPCAGTRRRRRRRPPDPG